MIRRREFITLVTGAVVMRPLGAQAQQAEQMRRIGVLMTGPADDTEQQELVAIFDKALSALGWNEGRNLKTYLRWGAASAKDIVAPEPRGHPGLSNDCFASIAERNQEHSHSLCWRV